MSDHLIIALSQRGVFSWATFRDILEEMFDDMFFFDSLIKPSHGLKILEGLGFISSNFNEGSGQLNVCPRTLVRIPSNPRHAILVGHRTADTQILLETICKSINGVTLDFQKNKLEFVPDRVMISVEDESVFLEIANQVEANYHPDPASWRILQFAGTLDDYVNKLPWENRPPYNWERSDFNTDSINFVPVNPNNNQPLINNSVLIQLKNPDYGRHEFYLYRNNPSQQICKVDRDWGRFLSLFEANKNVLLFSNSDKLAVPKQALLPSIFAIGLSMCSGFPPSDVYLNKKSYFVYQNIPREFGELVATKLGQLLIFDNTI